MKGQEMVDDCARFACSMSAYVDGELDPGHAVDMEAHVVGCGGCAERVALMRATRASLKRSCATRAPDALRARLAATMAAERQRAAEVEEAQRTLSPKLIRLRYAVGLAAAAGVALAMGMSRHALGTVHGGAASLPAANDSGTNRASVADINELIEDLVALHANPLPAETTREDELPRFEPLVGVPVRRPHFQPFGASFVGARVNARADRRTALLEYTVQGGHRVTVYVFDTRAIPVRAMPLERVARERPAPVYIGERRGYSIAAGERSGVGYALATDLDAERSAELMVAALAQ